MTAPSSIDPAQFLHEHLAQVEATQRWHQQIGQAQLVEMGEVASW